ncbi:MAG: DUF3240 family protein [Hyphomonadaceae bacterium]
MAGDICRLTVVYPPEAEDALVDLLEQSEPRLPGFTTWHARGHGFGFASASHAERVSGSVSRGVLVVVAGRERAEDLLAELKEKTPIQGLMFWMEPVLAAGRLS